MAPVVIDVSALPAHLGTIDALARLELIARRAGRRLALRGASSELEALLAFAGLDGVLGVEPGRQAPELEELLGLEEEGELDEPPA